MKKTLIALMALAGVAMAEPASYWSADDFGYVTYQTTTSLSLSSSTEIGMHQLNLPYGNSNTKDGLFVARDGSDTSVGFAKLVLTLNLTNLDNVGNIFSVHTESTQSPSAWGFALGEAGALTFGQMNNLIQLTMLTITPPHWIQLLPLLSLAPTAL